MNHSPCSICSPKMKFILLILCFILKSSLAGKFDGSASKWTKLSCFNFQRCFPNKYSNKLNFLNHLSINLNNCSWFLHQISWLSTEIVTNCRWKKRFWWSGSISVLVAEERISLLWRRYHFIGVDSNCSTLPWWRVRKSFRWQKCFLLIVSNDW